MEAETPAHFIYEGLYLANDYSGLDSNLNTGVQMYMYGIRNSREEIFVLHLINMFKKQSF